MTSRTPVWLEDVALEAGQGVNAAAFVAGHGPTGNLSPDNQPVFGHRTQVQVETGTQFELTRAATVRATGMLDHARLSHQAVRLAAGTHSAGTGTVLVFSAGAPVPTSLGMPQSSPATWDSPLLTAGTGGSHPLLATYGVIIATLFGAIGLPHILVRFRAHPPHIPHRPALLPHLTAEQARPETPSSWALACPGPRIPALAARRCGLHHGAPHTRA